MITLRLKIIIALAKDDKSSFDRLHPNHFTNSRRPGGTARQRPDAR